MDEIERLITQTIHRYVQAGAFITKQASLGERRVLHHLTMQKQSVPFSHALDLTTDAPAPVCQQDLRQPAGHSVHPIDLQRMVARRLARIHHANLDQATELGHIPKADRTYFEDVILADFREQLARFGSLYLDLPNYLVPESIPYYREALAELGLNIPEAEFTRCYGEAERYPGFKYMGFLLHLSAAGQLDSLQGPLLRQLLHGSRRPYDPM